MKYTAVIIAYFALAEVGSVLVLSAVVLAGLLPNPLTDPGYGWTAPFFTSTSVAITGAPLAILVLRRSSFRATCVIGFIQGILTLPMELGV